MGKKDNAKANDQMSAFDDNIDANDLRQDRDELAQMDDQEMSDQY